MRTNNPKLRLFIISVMAFVTILRLASSACCVNPDSEYLCKSEVQAGVDITAEVCCGSDLECIENFFNGTDEDCKFAKQVGLCEKVCCCLEEDTEETPVYGARCIFDAYEKYADQLEELTDEELEEYITTYCIKPPAEDCRTVCSNAIPTPTPTLEPTESPTLESFEVDTVDSKRKIAITWGLEMPPNSYIDNLYLHRCESQSGVCTSEIIKSPVPNVGFYEDSAVSFGKCYSYYLSIEYTDLTTGLESSQSFDELNKSDCVGSEKCLNKKLYSLFCVEDNIYSCEEDNALVDHQKPCSLVDSFCSDSSGKLGIFTSSCENENTKYYCYSDKAPSGINYCYDCVKNKQFIECYDYKSKDACQNNHCSVGGPNGCTWKPLVNSVGVDLGVCVDEAKDNCNYCGKLFATIVPSSQLPNAGNSLLFSKCNDALLPLLSVEGFSCARTMYCFENDVQSCFDYTDEEHCTYDECNINAHCTWSNGQCGKDINEDGTLDCEGLSGAQRLACENDVFPPNSNIGVVGSLADVLNMNLTFSITDKTSADSAPQRIEDFGSTGYKLFICSAESNGAGENIPLCMGFNPGPASGGISYVGSKLPTLISLVNAKFFDYGKINRIKYYAQDPAKNYQLEYNTLTIDLRGLEPCEEDLDCEYEGICSDIKRECVGGIYVNTCEIKRQLFESDPESGYEEVEESCDGLDNNCDGEVDEGLAQYCYLDLDDDGFGDPLNKTPYCNNDSKPDSCVDNNLDCNDTDPLVFPDAYEGVLDGSCFDDIDNNCDGKVDSIDPNCPLFDCNCGDESVGEPDYCPDFDQDIGGCTCFCNRSVRCTCGPDHFDMDLDGDGIPNHLDQQLRTPRACLRDYEVNKPNNPYVNELGVALDTDGDGVCNGADKCPTTVPGCAVVTNISSSEAGCPKDCTNFSSPCAYDPYCSQCMSCPDCGGGDENYCTRLICLNACGEDQCCVFNKTKSMLNQDFGKCYNGSEFREPYCSNEIRDDFTRETDVDCGGCVCDPCEMGKACLEDTDCESEFCNSSNRCDNITYWENLCSNEEFDNPFETDIDCGGVCLKFNKSCEMGSSCNDDEDCMQGGRCQDNVCVSESYLQSLCSNSEKDTLNGETDVDCGGDYCLSCGEGKNCSAGTDCQSGICFEEKCVVNTQVTCYFDADNDGYGNSSNKTNYWLLNETAPTIGGVKCILNGGDCNDGNELVFPGAYEGVLDGSCFDDIDNNCDGKVDSIDPNCPLFDCNCGDESVGEPDYCPDFDGDLGGCTCFCNSSVRCTCGPDHFDKDLDGDGVPNHMDQQLRTPRACLRDYEVNKPNNPYVNRLGVALDADRDGVCDGVDKCPATVLGCTVVANISDSEAGCPMDCTNFSSPCAYDPYCSQCVGCSDCGGGDENYCTKLICLNACGEDRCCVFNKTASSPNYPGLEFGKCYNGSEFKEPYCSNEIRDNFTRETDVDCGGCVCDPCEMGKACLEDTDCESEFCNSSNRCDDITYWKNLCSNEEFDNPFETDIDCGGVCLKFNKACKEGKRCSTGTDCQSGICFEGKCAVNRQVTCYFDVDNDGYGSSSNKTRHWLLNETAPTIGGVKCVPNSGDCNDSNKLVFPGAYEGVLDGSCFDDIDNDCDGKVDSIDPSCPLFDCNCGDESVGEPDYCPDFDGDLGGCTCFCNSSVRCTCGPDHFDMDLDGDGIPNHLDQQLRTLRACLGDYEVNKPNNPYVNELGVALDTDGDGVCNGADKCPTTVPGCAVVTNILSSEAGCPKDCTDFNSPCAYDPYCSQCMSCPDCGGGDENYCTRLICLNACGEDQCCVFNKTKSMLNQDFGKCYNGSEFREPYCSNEIRDDFTRETDVDCGGCVCDPCEMGKACLEDTDCKSEFCNSSNRCDNRTYWENLCSNEEFDNPFETDIDCGGVCLKFNKACEMGSSCNDDEDCIQGSRCQDGVCVSESYLQSLCSNSEKDTLNGETDVDCGGDYCLSCGEGKSCSAGTDCQSGICFEEKCVVNAQVTCYFDADNDGYGNPSNKTKYWLLNETAPIKNGVKCVLEGGDCNDSNKNVNPGMGESYLTKVSGVAGGLCFDGIDNDCNGHTDLADPGCPIYPCNCGVSGTPNDCSDFDRDLLDCDCFCSNGPGFSPNCRCGPDEFDNDLDGDGVINLADAQEFTPIECSGGRVNKWDSFYTSPDGIAYDTDNDGVCNRADQCKSTPAGCAVNENLSGITAGCPLKCDYPIGICSGDPFCSQCKSCANCGDGNPLMCTAVVCRSCGNCTFTAINTTTTGYTYGNCTARLVANISTDDCKNLVKDNDETDVDCGGAYCGECGIGKRCKLNTDCESGACSALTGKCINNTIDDNTETLLEKCSNGKKDSSEAGVDCGGVCLEYGKKCALGETCYTSQDCIQGECKPAGNRNECTLEACEGTGTNCGGDCPAKCMNGEMCLSDSDCLSSYCGSTGKCESKPSQEDSEDEKEGGGFGFLIVILIILLIGVAVVVYFLFFTGPKKGSQKSSSSYVSGSQGQRPLAKPLQGHTGPIPPLRGFEQERPSIKREQGALKGAEIFASFEDKDASPNATKQTTATTGTKLPTSSKSEGASSEKGGWGSETKTTENVELKKIIPSPTLKGSDGKSKEIDSEKQKVINKLEDVVGKDVSRQKGSDFDKLSSLSFGDEGVVKQGIGLKKYPKTKSSSNKRSSLSPKSKKAKTSANTSKTKKTAGNKAKKSSKK